jgi:hypothetical protein
MHQFDTMPADAKAWVYASNRHFTADEQKEIIAGALAFTNNWKSHGQSLKAEFNILHDLFLVLMVDESVNPVGGCGTDDSIHFMQEIEKVFNVKLFNRMQIELLHNDEIIITSKSGAAQLYNENKISEATPFFNKVITRKKDLENNFKIPFGKSWAFAGVKQMA